MKTINEYTALAICKIEASLEVGYKLSEGADRWGNYAVFCHYRDGAVESIYAATERTTQDEIDAIKAVVNGGT